MRAPLRAWLASRALVIGAAIVFSVLLGIPARGVDPYVPDWLSLLGGGDTTWYLDVARHGYAHDMGQVGEVYTNLAFFPLMPGIMAAAAGIAVNPLVAAVVVANLAFLGALWAMWGLTRGREGGVAADHAVWTLALLPAALYCSLAYTEGLALAGAIGAALAAVRDRWALAGLLAAVAALSRPTGGIVVLLLVLLAVREPAPGRWRRIALAAAPSVLAVGAFLGWMAAARGSALLPFEAQRAWDRGQLGIGLVTDMPREVAAGWDLVRDGHFTAAWTATARDLAFLVLYAWLLVRLWRREGGLRSPWVAYSAAVLAIPLSSGTIQSFARLGLLAFPLVWPLADWVHERPGRPRAAVAAAVLLIVLLVAQLEIRSP
ncbi:MAG TPA: hypothetical protein PKD59_10090 [Miltoncostaeaceae bacterium]|nr:hypothetical protein [Miltoncostaeaceae bacterium]